MKNRRYLLAITLTIVCGAVLLALFWLRKNSNQASFGTETSSDQSSVVGVNRAKLSNSFAGATPSQQEIAQAKERQWTAAFLTPISLYGKVVDQSGNPIKGAAVEIGINNNPLPNASGTSYVKTTGADGRFSISSHGIAYSLKASKDGFYSTKESTANRNVVTPAREDAPASSSDAPIVLVLHRQGETEPLIFEKTGQIDVPKTGQPIFVDLQTGRVGKSGLQISSWVGDYTQPKFDWRYQLSVPSGVIIERRNRFDFQAPTDGYKLSVEINMPSTAERWAIDGEGDYFAKLADGKFARFSVRFYPRARNFVVIESYINPKPGNRNLEFDPAKAVK